MGKSMEIGIIGLGKFDLRMALTLRDLGHTVIGIDASENRVQLPRNIWKRSTGPDATNLTVLRSLHMQELDWVVICVGESVELSLNITLNVQELAGSRLLVTASNEEHRKFCIVCTWTEPLCPRWMRLSWPRISWLIRACWT